MDGPFPDSRNLLKKATDTFLSPFYRWPWRIRIYLTNTGRILILILILVAFCDQLIQFEFNFTIDSGYCSKTRTRTRRGHFPERFDDTPLRQRQKWYGKKGRKYFFDTLLPVVMSRPFPLFVKNVYLHSHLYTKSSTTWIPRQPRDQKTFAFYVFESFWMFQGQVLVLFSPPFNSSNQFWIDLQFWNNYPLYGSLSFTSQSGTTGNESTDNLGKRLLEHLIETYPLLICKPFITLFHGLAGTDSGTTLKILIYLIIASFVLTKSWSNSKRMSFIDMGNELQLEAWEWQSQSQCQWQADFLDSLIKMSHAPIQLCENSPRRNEKNVTTEEPLRSKWIIKQAGR